MAKAVAMRSMEMNALRTSACSTCSGTKAFSTSSGAGTIVLFTIRTL